MAKVCGIFWDLMTAAPAAEEGTLGWMVAGIQRLREEAGRRGWGRVLTFNVYYGQELSGASALEVISTGVRIIDARMMAHSPDLVGRTLLLTDVFCFALDQAVGDQRRAVSEGATGGDRAGTVTLGVPMSTTIVVVSKDASLSPALARLADRGYLVVPITPTSRPASRMAPSELGVTWQELHRAPQDQQRVAQELHRAQQEPPAPSSSARQQQSSPTTASSSVGSAGAPAPRATPTTTYYLEKMRGRDKVHAQLQVLSQSRSTHPPHQTS